MHPARRSGIRPVPRIVIEGIKAHRVVQAHAMCLQPVMHRVLQGADCFHPIDASCLPSIV